MFVPGLRAPSPLSPAQERRRSPLYGSAAIAIRRQLVEDAWERDFKRGVTDLRAALWRLSLLLQCAVRVHDLREARSCLVLGFEGEHAGTPDAPPAFVIARTQRLVLLFSPRGGLDAAGELVAGPAAPIAPGQRWTHVLWADNPWARRWY